MTVYRRNSKAGPRWVVDIQIGGERINQTLPGVRTKAEAIAAQERLRAEYRTRQSRTGAVTQMTLATAIDRYVAEHLQPKTQRPDSLNTYIIYLGVIRDAFGADTPVEAITSARLAGWWGELVGRVQPNTAKRYLTQCKSVLAFARRVGGGNEVPTFSPTVPSDERTRWLTDDEEATLLAACPGWLADLVTFYLDTGARKADALSLTWRHARLPSSGRGSVGFTASKGGLTYSVPLAARTQAMLVHLRQARPTARLDDHIFLWPEGLGGTWVPVGDFKKSWARVLVRAEINDLHVHDLRHTFASRLVMRSVPLLDVSKLLGHASIKMTARYAHLAPEAFDRAIAVLDRAGTT